MPKRGVAKINPNSMPQNIPLIAPMPTKSTSCFVLGLFFPAGQETMAASCSLIRCCFCRSRTRLRASFAPSGVGNLRTVTVAIVRLLSLFLLVRFLLVPLSPRQAQLLPGRGHDMLGRETELLLELL